jgi:hypothetical protein
MALAMRAMAETARALVAPARSNERAALSAYLAAETRRLADEIKCAPEATKSPTISDLRISVAIGVISPS